ncbi:MAG: hypothetical protein ACREIU_16330, partial [Planctomycetota bacterium]
GQYNYDTGAPNAGALRTPRVGLPAGTKNVLLSFDYLLQTEVGGTSSFDQAWVEAASSFSAPPSWTALSGTPIPGNSPCPSLTVFTQTAPPGSPLAPLVGEGGSLRFRFDTGTNQQNNYAGWSVDNVFLTGGPICFFQRYGQGCAPGCGPVDTPGCNTSCATFPRIGATGVPSSPSPGLTLAFQYAKQTEANGTGSFDQCFVEAKPTGGAWQLLTQVIGNITCPASTTLSLSVPGITDTTWRHRFRFDTIDGAANNFQGWTVDNVVATDTAGPTVVFSEDFQGPGLGAYTETDPSGNPASTLWHRETTCNGSMPLPSTMGGAAASYNQGDLGIYNYVTGMANAGAIESPDIPASPGFAIEVSQAPLSSPAFLAVSVPLPVIPPPNPLSIFGLPAPCCQLETGVALLLLVSTPTDSSGGAKVALQIPPGITGDFFAQWLCLGPGGAISMSDGGILGVR